MTKKRKTKSDTKQPRAKMCTTSRTATNGPLDQSKTPHLESVESENKSGDATATTPPSVSACGQECEQGWDTLNNSRQARGIRQLIAGCSPAVLTIIGRHLADPTPADKAMLAAWRRCGGKDAQSGERVHVSQAGRQTMSPLGLACLIAYVEGYLGAMFPARWFQTPIDTSAPLQSLGQINSDPGPVHTAQSGPHAHDPVRERKHIDASSNGATRPAGQSRRKPSAGE